MLNKAQIKKVILSKFPNSKIESIKEFSEGYNNIVYDVRLNDKRLVFKLIKLGKKRKLALKQKRLKDLMIKKYKEFPIAEIIDFDFSEERFGFPYLILERINGDSLKSKFEEIKNKEELFKKLGEIYGKIHSIKFEKYGELDSELNLFNEYSNWYEKKCIKIEEIFDKIKGKSLLPKDDFENQSNYFNKNKEILKIETKPTLCHGDASDTNILVESNGNKFEIKGIIDFEFLRSSGATEDLFNGFEFSKQKLKFRNSMIKGYLKFSELPEGWEKLVNFYQWIKNLNRISNIDSMSWRNLSEQETIERKNKMKRKTLKDLREIASRK
jgi:Ser/Thr protein kinase RdoA (MazF antagonist)